MSCNFLKSTARQNATLGTTGGEDKMQATFLANVCTAGQASRRAKAVNAHPPPRRDAQESAHALADDSTKSSGHSDVVQASGLFAIP
eukprot:1282704-Rhodomonas_salina.1